MFFKKTHKEDKMNITLCGYGVVGKGVEKLCELTNDLNIQYIYVRKEKEDLPRFSNEEHIVEDPSIDIVMECMNGLEPANTLIRKALKAKKHVITSNKAVIATYLEDYLDLAKDNDTTIQIEACVAGGIPFLDALLKLQRLEPIQGYEGIFNGTSNYILDQMTKNALDYEVALKNAQDLGYAEKDPTNDVEGIDVYYKAVISNMLAYKNKKLELPKPVGISKISSNDIALAKENGKIIRHLAISVCKDEKVCTIIAPAFLDNGTFLANVENNYNAQTIHAHSFETLGYLGQGAGQLATAQAMMQNAIDTLENKERTIILTNTYTYDETLIKENWIIRSNKELTINYTKKDGSYYWIEQMDQTIIQKIKKQDTDAMIAIWR